MSGTIGDARKRHQPTPTEDTAPAETLAEVVHPNRNDERDIRPWRPADGDLRCQSCGRPNVIWYADNDLWNRVMPDDGILCIGCFIHRAEAYIGTAAWGLFADAAPFRSEFRRGFEAGMAARVEQARAGEGALRERIEALASEWDEMAALNEHTDLGLGADALRAVLAEGGPT